MKRWIKQVLSLGLTLTLIMTLTVNVGAVNQKNADRLHTLGLFQGTKYGYALENTATRMQGLIMLTRLLGEEEQALNTAADCPFNDVTGEKSIQYAAYGVERGYTHGTGDGTTFAPGKTIGFKHYITFLLRALGYNDRGGDFSFQNCLNKAVEIGLLNRSTADFIASSNPTFYRSDLVDLSLSALTMEVKGSGSTLAEKLSDRGIFTRESGLEQKVLDCGKITYVHPSQRPVSTAITHHNGAYQVPSGIVKADVFTVDTQNPDVSVHVGVAGSRLGVTDNFKNLVTASGAELVVNGNFFEAYNNSKFPIGHVMSDGNMYYGISGLNSVCFTERGEVRIGRPPLFYFVEGAGCSWACYEVNSRQQVSSGSVLYNSKFGSTVTLQCAGVITTVMNGIIEFSDFKPAGTIVTIPRNGFVMFFGQQFASTDYYQQPVIGTAVSMSVRPNRKDVNFDMTGVVNMVSGAPRLVENGSMCMTLEPGFQESRFTTAKSPRTAAGVRADGKLILLSTSAATIQQLRELMLQLGCMDAVNLDGGASTALAYRGKVLRNPGRQLTTTLEISVDY